MTANLSQRRSHARHGAKVIEATITAALDELEQQKAAEHADRKAARERAEAERHRYTRDELGGARAIRTGSGWHKVVRVNATSVTVETPYSWTDRIPFDKILQAIA